MLDVLVKGLLPPFMSCFHTDKYEGCESDSVALKFSSRTIRLCTGSHLHCESTKLDLFSFELCSNAELCSVFALANTVRFLSRVSTLTRDIDIADLSVRSSVCVSVRDVSVLDENGLTYCHSFFFTVRLPNHSSFIGIKHLDEIPMGSSPLQWV